jgi:hypothetical protein
MGRCIQATTHPFSSLEMSTMVLTGASKSSQNASKALIWNFLNLHQASLRA